MVQPNTHISLSFSLDRSQSSQHFLCPISLMSSRPSLPRPHVHLSHVSSCLSLSCHHVHLSLMCHHVYLSHVFVPNSPISSCPSLSCLHVHLSNHFMSISLMSSRPSLAYLHVHLSHVFMDIRGSNRRNIRGLDKQSMNIYYNMGASWWIHSVLTNNKPP